MDKQNITLAIPKDVLQRFKLLAVRRGSSVSGLMRRLMEAALAEEESYQAAQREFLALMERGHELGTYGQAGWEREELHER